MAAGPYYSSLLFKKVNPFADEIDDPLQKLQNIAFLTCLGLTVSYLELRICCICVDGRWGRNKNLVPCIGLPSLWTSSCKLVMVSSTSSSFEDRKYFHVSLFFPVLPAPHCLLHVRCSFSSNNSQGKIPHSLESMLSIWVLHKVYKFYRHGGLALEMV
ncbi:hypothetical protein Peur_016484 [Populus x canadensis]